MDVLSGLQDYCVCICVCVCLCSCQVGSTHLVSHGPLEGHVVLLDSCVDIGVVCTKRFESGWLFPHLCLISWNWLLKGERACFSNNSKYCTHTCMDSYKLTEPINRKCGSEVDMWRNFLCVCSWSLKHGNPWSYERIAFHWSKSYGGKHLVHLNSVQSYPKPFFFFLMISLLFITGIKKMTFWAKLHSKNDFFPKL